MTKSKKKKDKEFTPPPRQCDGCTMCCEGWLQAEAQGYAFYPGQPCHWVGCNGCTIYEDRPEVCSSFQCAWKINHFLPEWFKPTLSNVIANWKTWKKTEDCTPEDGPGIYLSIVECGKPMTVKCLTWLNNYVAGGALNVRYQYEGRWHYMGTEPFKQWCIEGATKPQ